MLSDSFFGADGADTHASNDVAYFHKRNYSVMLWALIIGLGVFIVWASVFNLDQVVKANGEVIASSRVQIIQAVDGGVLAKLNVREGDRVQVGQVLAQLDQTRFGASVKEIEARLSALQIKATRLRAEVTQAETLSFPSELQGYPGLITVEQSLFRQRQSGLQEELRTFDVAVKLAQEELSLLKNLARSGDVNRSEVIRAERAMNDAQAKRIVRKNGFLEEANTELTRAEDEIAQNKQILAQRKQQLEDSVFTALVPGIVKNVSVTTIGGVLRAGEELMQIIPVDDDLIFESKVRPEDIAQVKKGLTTTIRFDPFDYTIYGGVIGTVVYVSADTLKEETSQGVEIYYRVHVASNSAPVMTTTGRQLDILPGMTAQVDIKTGQRTLMDYLLKPIRKTLSESLGER